MHPLLEDVLSSGGKREQKPKRRKNVPRSATTDEELADLLDSVSARILVAGVGGAGNNAITRLMEVGVEVLRPLHLALKFLRPHQCLLSFRYLQSLIYSSPRALMTARTCGLIKNVMLN